MTLYQPQNGWDGKIAVGLSGDAAFTDASELYQVNVSENYNPDRRRQLGVRNNAYMPGRWDATGKCEGYFITGAMATKLYGVADVTSRRDHAARSMIQFNLKVDFSAFPITVKAGALAAGPTIPTLTTATTGGVLAPGTYAYRVSAIVGGVETDVSPEATIVVPAGTSTNKVTVSWAAVASATGYRVYGRSTGTELMIANLGNFTSFVDDSGQVPSGAMPVAGAAISLTGYLYAGCLLATDGYDLVDNTYVAKPYSFMIQKIYDIYSGDTDAQIAALML